MSQSPNSTDTQALLQSMLQRLRIQQGKDSETQQQIHVPNSGVSTCGEEGAAEASSKEILNNGPIDGFKFGSNGIPSKEFRISETDQSFSLKGEVVQKPVNNWEVDKGHISFPIQKDNRDGGTGQNKVVGQEMQPEISPAETGQIFPVKLSQDTNVTSYRSNMETGNIGSEQIQNQGFQPKVFAWSSNPKHVAGSPQYRVLPVENPHMTATDVDIERAGFSRKQQSMGNKTRRWTQKIKARWKDRPGSFGKKQKEEQREAQQIGQQAEISPQQLPRINSVISTMNGEEESVVSTPGTSNPIKTAVTRTEDTNNKVHTSSDFEFGLGSFSLLEEITSGQEWANFLTPPQTSASAHLRPLQKVPKPTFSTQSLIPNHSCDNQRGFQDGQFSDISMVQAWPGDFQPAGMDISEEPQCVQSRGQQAGLMEHGHTPADATTRWQTRLLSQRTDIESNLVMTRRLQMNRKRHHHLTERREENLQLDINHPDQEGFTTSWSSCEMGVAQASHQDGGLPFCKYPPLSPSFSPSLPCPPKGVLQHSISQDSQASMEILTKRRRVEEKRRVHFLEQVVTITPPELDPDSSDSEEDLREEGDSVQELEHEEEQAGIEEVAPARRSALSAWILSLKKMNSQRKQRK